MTDAPAALLSQKVTLEIEATDWQSNEIVEAGVPNIVQCHTSSN